MGRKNNKNARGSKNPLFYVLCTGVDDPADEEDGDGIDERETKEGRRKGSNYG